MKEILYILIFILSFIRSNAQFTVSGMIRLEKDSSLLQEIILSIDNSPIQYSSDHSGSFKIPDLNAGLHTLNFSHLSFQKKQLLVNLQSDTSLIIMLAPSTILANEVLISALRVTPTAPFAFSDLSKADIESSNFGQDITYLLNILPSAVTTSDAGNGVGYTGIRIRGSDASRINVTINGIPLNDAESQNVYWVDLPDLASSAENIQVQRGVGSSTNGAGAFGGSINVQTVKISELPSIETSFSAGSFNTLKSTISMGSGLINNHWFADGRLSKITSDGYIDRATSDLRSVSISGGYAGPKTIVKLQILSGKEITYQSWNGVPESRYNNDLEGMQNYIYRNSLHKEDSANLLNSGRTYNGFTYENQVDNYGQDHFQLMMAHEILPDLSIQLAVHYTNGKGYYEEFVRQDKLSLYGLNDIYIGKDTIITSDVVRRKWLSNDFYGCTYSLNYDITKNQKLIFGGAFNEYSGDHFNELTWLQWASNSKINQHYYDDHAFKTDFNAFAKYNININNRFNIYIDQQYRFVNYHYNGYNADGKLMPMIAVHHFFNPKAGLFYQLNKSQNIYSSVSVGHKEPNRDDYTQNTYTEKPSSEQLIDYEVGYSFQSKKMAIQTNIYYMDYIDQLVLKGDLNEVGNNTRMNVKKSYRLGIELTGSCQVNTKIKLSGTITISRNKIDQFNYILDASTDSSYSKASTVFKNTDIAYSPNITCGGTITYNPFRNLTIKLNGKYVGQQFLDNTQSEARKLKDYTIFDVIVNYDITIHSKNYITLGLLLNNIGNKFYTSNGYTYGYIYNGSEIHENFYYPQAGFNFLGKVAVRF